MSVAHHSKLFRNFAYVSNVSVAGSYACRLAIRFLQLIFACGSSSSKPILHPLHQYYNVSIVRAARLGHAFITRVNKVATFLAFADIIHSASFSTFFLSYRRARSFLKQSYTRDHRYHGFEHTRKSTNTTI